MEHGYIKAAALSPKIKVADTKYNGEVLIHHSKEAAAHGAHVIVFPELCVTGYSCGDLFLQELLLQEAKNQLFNIAEQTAQVDAVIFVGLPLAYKSKLYNTAAVLHHGKVLGIVPKTFLPNYAEFYEARHFTRGMKKTVPVTLREGVTVPMGTDQIFVCDTVPQLRIAVELCEDVWSPNPPSIAHALAGANLIVNLSASDEVTGKDTYRRELVAGQSARLVCGYIYANASDGESTQDVVYAGHSLIAENGIVLQEAERFTNAAVYSEIDVRKLEGERRRMSTFEQADAQEYTVTHFSLQVSNTKLTRFVDSTPFVPGDKSDRDKRCEEILAIQAMGLKKRLEHTGCTCAVVGISGGLDSTLALLVTVRAFDLLQIPRKQILAVTMPGFGTTDRTYDNAVHLINRLGADLKEISICDAVHVHFHDIGQDPHRHDVTYENSQARERTQILMDIANMYDGMVIGTGDMSELALGWATYNGDHMSMYGVNASVPKTLVRHLVRYYADTCADSGLSEVLLDVLDTPVSPELLPPTEGRISQKTEDIVGPYELHDFFLYYVLRFGFEPGKVYRLAQTAFGGDYDNETIWKWLKTFYRRFFTQQFKRSCLPDGPKVGSVAVSPRGDLRMPSDACMRIWMDEIEKMKEI
ncbi:Glutamine-dependent NAD(+) synthetase [Eubacterium plexicaudatum ASF492]|uniref:Glutamine-dependent NAD(+) synthetase n=1 Tax=Eubacterium plexicaudatum ASF492 TaxID=1235802 RepID=N2ACN7_9FIRM|nr:Glutamine-dependent NAD(+) synthetase [Eubacterium plexicaudatum ASF492]